MDDRLAIERRHDPETAIADADRAARVARYAAAVAGRCIYCGERIAGGVLACAVCGSPVRILVETVKPG
jgi:hypothetical protein